MFQLISKPLILALLVAANQPRIPQPEDRECYAYYLKMRDIDFGTLEYVVNRNKTLELRCGAYYRAEPEK